MHTILNVFVVDYGPSHIKFPFLGYGLNVSIEGKTRIRRDNGVLTVKLNHKARGSWRLIV